MTSQLAPTPKTSIEAIADNYERMYGFMALNAVARNARMFGSHGIQESVDECGLVGDELVRRGYVAIRSEDEYLAGVKAHGVPLAFATNDAAEERA